MQTLRQSGLALTFAAAAALLNLPVLAQTKPAATQPIVATAEMATLSTGATLREKIVKPTPVHQDSDFTKNMLEGMYEKAKAVSPNLAKRDFVLAFHDKAVTGDVEAGYIYGAARMIGWGIAVGPQKEVESYIGAGAKAGKPEALRDYALIELFGIGVPESNESAFAYAKKSADAGLPSGQALAAEFLQSGVGTKKDLAAAITLYRKAADAGDLIACYTYGLLLLSPLGGNVPDAAKSINYFQKAAAGSDDRALDQLGLMLIFGDGLKTDEELGYKYLEYAAVMGEPDAQRRIGISYLNGSHGHPQSDEAGALYLESAATNGDSEAQIEWGLINLDGGRGIAQNHDEGIKWISKAAKQGNPRAAAEMRKRL